MNSKKILAVWGSPSSGKTLNSIKLANILSRTRKNVIVVFFDPFIPTIPVVLPFHEGGKSLGEILTAPQITQEKILSSCLTLKKNSYLSFLGYRFSENVFTYPEYNRSNAMDFLIQLRHIADYVIVDCTSHISADILSTTALEMADAVLRLGTCDLKGVSYFSSQLQYLMERRFNPDRHIKILSNLKSGQPVAEIKESYNGVHFEISFVQELEDQFRDGILLESATSKEGKKHEGILKQLIGEVFHE